MRVVMVVANDVTRDSRVLREAEALARAGHQVTVLGMMTARTTAPAREVRDGFVIHRLSYRAKPPSWWVPPDFYGRMRARARRQLILHRAAVTRWFRRVHKNRRGLGRRVDLVEHQLRRARRMSLSRFGRLAHGVRRRATPAITRAWRFASGAADGSGIDSWRGIRTARRKARIHRARVRASLRALRRFLSAPPSEWPGKAQRTARRASTAIVGWGHGGSALVGNPWVRMRRDWRIGTMPLRVRGEAFGVRGGQIASAPLGLGLAAARTVGRGGRAWLGIIALVLWGSGFLLVNWMTRGAVDWVTGWRWRWFGWAEYVSRHAPDADVWHGHDLTSLPAIVALKRARGGVAVYDSHEIYLESGLHARQPRWAKGQLERLERRLTDEVDAVLTVNDSLASILVQRLRTPDVGVLYNCPSRYQRDATESRMRDALKLDAATPLAMYHGSLVPHRGIEQLLIAITDQALRDVHLAFLGHGSLMAWLREEAESPRFGGRVHVLDGVPPADLLSWIAGVDVAVVPIQPSTMNHVFSSPNKVFEAIAVGTPVAGSDFPEFRKVVFSERDGPLGVLFDPTDPSAIAVAIDQLIRLAPDERRALRERCLQSARRRWNWETESGQLIDLYRRFASERTLSLAA